MEGEEKRGCAELRVYVRPPEGGSISGTEVQRGEEDEGKGWGGTHTNSKNDDAKMRAAGIDEAAESWLWPSAVMCMYICFMGNPQESPQTHTKTRGGRRAVHQIPS